MLAGPTRSVIMTIVLLGVVATVAGCGYQTQTTSAGVTEIRFGTGTYVAVIVIPLILSGVGIFVIKNDRSILQTMAIIGIIVLLLFVVAVVPGIWRDAVRVDHQGVTQTTGLWWSPTVKGFQFAQTREVRIVRKPAGPDNRVQTIWEIVPRNGGATQDIDPGDLWENGSDVIVKLTNDHGVTVHDMR